MLVITCTTPLGLTTAHPNTFTSPATAGEVACELSRDFRLSTVTVRHLTTGTTISVWKSGCRAR